MARGVPGRPFGLEGTGLGRGFRMGVPGVPPLTLMEWTSAGKQKQPKKVSPNPRSTLKSDQST